MEKNVIIDAEALDGRGVLVNVIAKLFSYYETDCAPRIRHNDTVNRKFLSLFQAIFKDILTIKKGVDESSDPLEELSFLSCATTLKSKIKELVELFDNSLDESISFEIYYHSELRITERDQRDIESYVRGFFKYEIITLDGVEGEKCDFLFKKTDNIYLMCNSK